MRSVVALWDPNFVRSWWGLNWARAVHPFHHRLIARSLIVNHFALVQVYCVLVASKIKEDLLLLSTLRLRLSQRDWLSVEGDFNWWYLLKPFGLPYQDLNHAFAQVPVFVANKICFLLLSLPLSVFLECGDVVKTHSIAVVTAHIQRQLLALRTICRRVSTCFDIVFAMTDKALLFLIFARVVIQRDWRAILALCNFWFFISAFFHHRKIASVIVADAVGLVHDELHGLVVCCSESHNCFARPHSITSRSLVSCLRRLVVLDHSLKLCGIRDSQFSAQACNLRRLVQNQSYDAKVNNAGVDSY